MKNKRLGRSLRYLFAAMATLIALFLILVLLLNIPLVQNAVVHYVTEKMSENLGAKVSIDEIQLRFFKTVSVRGIYIEDLNRDTLVYAQELDIDIGILSLLSKKLEVNSLTLQKTKIDLHRNGSDSVYNYQFIIDGLAGGESDTSTSAWTIGIGKLRLQNVLFEQYDEVSKFSLYADVGSLVVYADNIDIAEKEISLRQIGLGETRFEYRDFHENDPVDSLDLNEDDSIRGVQTLQFPGLDWDLTVYQLRVDQGAFVYDVAAAPRSARALNFQHLDLDAIDLALDHLHWGPEVMEVDLENASLEDASGFELDQLEADFSMAGQYIHVDDFSLVTPESKVNSTTHLDFNYYSDLRSFVDSVIISAEFTDSEISYTDLNYLVPQLKKLPYLDMSLDQKILVDGTVEGTVDRLTINDLLVRVEDLVVLDLDGKVNGVTTSNPDVDLKINEVSTSHANLEQLTRGLELPDGLSPWGRFFLSGNVTGKFDDLYGRSITLETESVTRFEGSFHIAGLPRIEKTVFDLNVIELRSVSNDLDGFSETGMPNAMDSLGQFFFRGNFLGTIYDFKVDGELISDAGNIDTNVDMEFASDFSNAEYSGDIFTDSFHIAKVFGLESLGYLSMNVHSYGQGLDFTNLKTVVMGEVGHFDFNGYSYQGLQLDGRFDKKQFAGHAEIDDENIKFDFEGVINLADTLSKFRFRSVIDTIDFRALNLMDQELAMSARVNSDFRGNGYLNMKGDVLIRELTLSNLNHTYKTDSIYIASDNSVATQKKITVESEILSGFIEGDYNLVNLPALFRDYANEYFPLEEVIDSAIIVTDSTGIAQMDSTSTEPTTSQVNDQNFSFEFRLTGARPAISLVATELHKMDSVIISGDVNTARDSLLITGHLGQLEYGSFSLAGADWSLQGDGSELVQVIEIDQTEIPGGIHFPYFYADATLRSDTAYFSTILTDETDTLVERLSLAAQMTKREGLYVAHFNPAFFLNGKEWSIDDQNEIQFGKNLLQIENLSMTQDQQSISFSTTDDSDGDFLPYKIVFDQFRIREISDFIKLEQADYDGALNGEIELRNLGQSTGYLADLTIEDLTLTGEEVGTLTLRSNQRTADLLDVMLTIDGNVSGLDVRGTYNTRSDVVDVQGEMDRFALNTLDPFLRGTIHDSRGIISGMVDVQGTSKAPQINASFELDSLSTVVDYLQGRYTFDNEKIEIRDNNVVLNDFSMRDGEGNLAVLNGSALIKETSLMELNLEASTDKFIILNTSLKDNNLFFGKVIVSADVQIGGTTEEPVLDINGKTLAGTDLIVQPLTYEGSVEQESFIIFANPETYESDTSLSVQDLYKLSQYGLDLSANIEVTSDASLTIVIDPATGDKLVCKGDASLNIQMTKEGELEILGSYSITEGQYAFNFQRVLKRTFDIEQGSTVTFVGDPLDSRFDITAIYSLRTTTYELIRNESTLNESEESQARQRTDVDVKLNLRGDLESPEASFDIIIPETSGGGVTTSVGAKLAQLREDESSLNKQVFGLLIFNSFIAEEQGTDAASLITDAGQSAILSSVGNLLSNQLNNIASRYIKGVDIDFGVDSYTDTYGTESSLVTELEVGLSKRLLNDRLTVQVGGNVQFDNEESVELEPGSNSTFSGDFTLEYKLTEDGNYRLRFFQVLSDEEQIFNPGVNYSETGAAIFFTKSFNSKKYRSATGEIELK